MAPGTAKETRTRLDTSIEQGLDVKITGGIHTGCLRLQVGAHSDIMSAKDPYTAISRTMHIHPTVSELVPTMLEEMKPLR